MTVASSTRAGTNADSTRWWGQHWVPVGFAHGFLTLSEHADVHYKASGYWSKACERSIRWDDSELAIAWPLERLGGIKPLLDFCVPGNGAAAVEFGLISPGMMAAFSKQAAAVLAEVA